YPEESRMPQRHKPSETGQDHEAEASKGIDQDEDGLGQPERSDQPWHENHDGEHQYVPAELTGFSAQADDLRIAGFEDVSHACQTFLCMLSPNSPCGLTTSMINTTT